MKNLQILWLSPQCCSGYVTSNHRIVVPRWHVLPINVSSWGHGTSPWGHLLTIYISFGPWFLHSSPNGGRYWINNHVYICPLGPVLLSGGRKESNSCQRIISAIFLSLSCCYLLFICLFVCFFMFRFVCVSNLFQGLPLTISQHRFRYVAVSQHCQQATSHCPEKCWHKSVTQYGCNRIHWVT